MTVSTVQVAVHAFQPFTLNLDNQRSVSVSKPTKIAALIHAFKQKEQCEEKKELSVVTYIFMNGFDCLNLSLLVLVSSQPSYLLMNH